MAQIQQQRLANEYTKLRDKYDILLVKNTELRDKAALRKGRSAMIGEDQLILYSAKAFVVMHEPWVERPALDQLISLDLDSLETMDVKTRYSNQSACTLGVLTELWEALTPQLRETLADKNKRVSFKKTVWHS
jgi:hypothetical protein